MLSSMMASEVRAAVKTRLEWKVARCGSLDESSDETTQRRADPGKGGEESLADETFVALCLRADRLNRCRLATQAAGEADNDATVARQRLERERALLGELVHPARRPCAKDRSLAHGQANPAVGLVPGREAYKQAIVLRKRGNCLGRHLLGRHLLGRHLLGRHLCHRRMHRVPDDAEGDRRNTDNDTSPPSNPI